MLWNLHVCTLFYKINSVPYTVWAPASCWQHWFNISPLASQNSLNYCKAHFYVLTIWIIFYSCSWYLKEKRTFITVKVQKMHFLVSLSEKVQWTNSHTVMISTSKQPCKALFIWANDRLWHSTVLWQDTAHHHILLPLTGLWTGEWCGSHLLSNSLWPAAAPALACQSWYIYCQHVHTHPCTQTDWCSVYACWPCTNTPLLSKVNRWDLVFIPLVSSLRLSFSYSSYTFPSSYLYLASLTVKNEAPFWTNVGLNNTRKSIIGSDDRSNVIKMMYYFYIWYQDWLQ